MTDTAGSLGTAHSPGGGGQRKLVHLWCPCPVTVKLLVRDFQGQTHMSGGAQDKVDKGEAQKAGVVWEALAKEPANFSKSQIVIILALGAIRFLTQLPSLCSSKADTDSS